MNWNELRDKAYQSAIEHGFHNESHSDEHWKMQIVCELAEMAEAHRKGNFADVEAFKKSDTVNDFDFKDKFRRFIKDTMEDEMADIVIYMLDYSGLKHYDVGDNIQFVLNFLSMYGFEKVEGTISEIAYRLTKDFVCSKTCEEEESISSVISTLYFTAKNMNIDLIWHIEQKMRYNKLRPMLNGKLY